MITVTNTGSSACPACCGSGIQTLLTGEKKVCGVCAGGGVWSKPEPMPPYKVWCEPRYPWEPNWEPNGTITWVGTQNPDSWISM
jgi:hypothetical protein